jgi:N6-adenosine-specific RNA methylase IME4
MAKHGSGREVGGENLPALMNEKLPALPLYNTARRALAEVVSIDEVKEIRNKAVAMKVYAEQAKDRQLIEGAIEVQMRAERRAGELLREMGKNRGGAEKGVGRRGVNNAVASNDRVPPAKLSDLGITKTQSSRWQRLASIDVNVFEGVIADTRDKVARAQRNAVREIEIDAERAAYRSRTNEGGTAEDLEALAARGFRAGVICPDFPWEFEAWSRKGKQRSAERYYETWPLERIFAFAPIIGRLAAPDCALLLWTVWSQLPGALEVITACGFEYKTVGFCWVKTTRNAKVITLDGNGLHTGQSLSGTEANNEICLLAKRGSPLRLAKDVHQVVIAPVGEQHSAKPDEIYRRIERLYPGPYLELFARKPRAGWTVWGNEIAPYDANADFAGSLDDCYAAVRERVAAGGEGWKPR